MKKIILLFSGLFITITTLAASGGPDAYGYVWADSNEPGGPAYSWIDITGTGTLVNGLTDDNSVAFITMGMDFHYYWGDYSQIKIGSNGWLSFDNTGNIAHCFPSIPSPGGASDNFLAPFMTDLNFSEIGNPAEVYYYHDVANEQFIVSYINAPWWQAASPFYVGDNSFQVILDAQDSSITFQYQNADAANFLDNTTCASDVVIGIEGPTGSVGLSVYEDTMPPSNYAIKFTYPNPVLLSIPDVTPYWSLNSAKGGELRFNGQNVPLAINIKTVGNVDVMTDIVVDVLVQDQFLTSVGTYQQTISGGLLMGDDTTIQFTWVPSTIGQYSVRTIVINTDDINATNDTLITEIEVIDPNPVPSRLSYVNPTDIQAGQIAWGGNDDGVAAYFVPNSYPFIIDSIGAYVTGFGDFKLEMYDDDGTNGEPGTIMHSETFLSGSVTLNNWIKSILVQADTIYSGGFYIAWIQPTGSSAALGTVLDPPFSRRNLELVTGWATYRDNEIQDFMLEAFGSPTCGLLTSTAIEDSVSCLGGSDGAIDLSVTGGTPSVLSGYTFAWTGGAGSNEDPSNLSMGSYMVTVTDSLGCSHEATYFISQPTGFTLDTTIVGEVAGNDGSIDLTVSGATPPYTFSWSNGAGTNEDAANLAGGSYTVTITDANGCDTTLTATVDSQVGFEDLSEIDWNIFPNPSNGMVSIQLNKSYQNGILEVVDLTGRVLLTKTAEDYQNIEINSAGTYIITLKTANATTVKRVVIQN
jgi:hypothetical protein